MNHRRWIFALFVCSALLACLYDGAAAFAQKPARPQPRIARVLIVSIDGLRPDCMLLADAPTLRELIRGGSYSLWCKTTVQSVTLPSNVSMLTGVTVEGHGITWNGDMPFREPVWPRRPTLFEIAKKAGYSTGMAAGKDKFDLFLKPGIIDHSFVTEKSVCTDAEVATAAVGIVLEHAPEVMFLHLPNVDSVGHSIGWGTPQQLQAIAEADASLKRVLDAYRQKGLFDETLVIVSADHGGCGKTHGPEDVRSRTIPWIAFGPGVRAGYDLTLLGRTSEVQTFDTFATAAHVLGVASDRGIDGKAQLTIFESGELLQTTMPTTQMSR